MRTRLSLAPYAKQGYAVLPIGRRGPQVCLSLLSAGDMQGDGEGEENRRRLFDSLGVAAERVLGVEQIHSRRVLSTEELPSEGRAEADGLVTSDPQEILSVRVADCYPIFLSDSRRGVFAVVHSGWRGTGIAAEALALMERRHGSRVSDIAVLLGPGIRSCCYDVPAERAELFRERFGVSAVVEREGRTFLDLAAANIVLLEEAGVSDITEVIDCTSCSSFLPSYRRQGAEGYDHMVALIGYFR